MRRSLSERCLAWSAFVRRSLVWSELIERCFDEAAFFSICSPRCFITCAIARAPGFAPWPRFAPPIPHRSAPPVNAKGESRVCILPYAFCAYGRLPALSLIKHFHGSSKCTLWVAFSAHSAASPSRIWPSTCAFVHQIFSEVGRMYTWAGLLARTSPFGRRLVRTRQFVDRAASLGRLRLAGDSLGRPPLGRATHSDAPVGPGNPLGRWNSTARAIRRQPIPRL